MISYSIIVLIVTAAGVVAVGILIATPAGVVAAATLAVSIVTEPAALATETAPDHADRRLPTVPVINVQVLQEELIIRDCRQRRERPLVLILLCPPTESLPAVIATPVEPTSAARGSRGIGGCHPGIGDCGDLLRFGDGHVKVVVEAAGGELGVRVLLGEVLGVQRDMVAAADFL